MTDVFRSRVNLVWSGVIWLALCGFALAQHDLDAVLTDLKAVQANENASVDELRAAVAKVQRIVDDFPASDAAVSVLLGENYKGIVFGAFEQRLTAALETLDDLDQAQAQLGSNDKEACLTSAIADRSGVRMLIGFSTDAGGNLADLPEIIEPKKPNSEDRLQYLGIVAALEKCAPYQNSGSPYQLKLSDAGRLSLLEVTPSPAENDSDAGAIGVEAAVTLPVGSESTEKGLGLDKQAIRDIQARLMVIGHDPNGVDGVLGKGTRSAIQAWQTTVSAEPTGYLNKVQLSTLKTQSQGDLEEWLRSEDNAKLYEPPPVLAIGPQNMSGNWRYTTNCGSRSRLGRLKITGIFAMQHAGGRNYTGTLSNSQGLRGRVSATLKGRSVSAVTNFGLLVGKVNLNARVDDYELVLRGRDSNGCSFYASKR